MKKITVNSKKISHLFYKIYWFLLFGPMKDCRNEIKNNHRVYDNLGIIDTLGYNYEEGKYTFAYSEELGSYSGIKLPFGYAIYIYDDFIRFDKFNSLL